MTIPTLDVGVVSLGAAYRFWELWFRPVQTGRAMIAQAIRFLEKKVLPVARMDNIDAMKAGALLGRV